MVLGQEFLEKIVTAAEWGLVVVVATSILEAHLIAFNF
jgi:hypothetical protein